MQLFSRYWALSLLGSRLNVSRSRDVIGHVTIRLTIGHFLFVFFRQFSHNTYITNDKQKERRQTDATLYHKRDR